MSSLPQTESSLPSDDRPDSPPPLSPLPLTSVWQTLLERLNQPTAPVITQPVPLWQFVSQRALRVLLWILIPALSFLVGRYFPAAETVPASLSAPIQASTSAPAPNADTAARDDATQPPAATDTPTAAEAGNGLAVQGLSVWIAAGDSRRLHYAYTLVNNGPRFVGQAAFLLSGNLAGERKVIDYPGETNDPKLNLSVSRLLKMEGSVVLPAGFSPQSVQLRLSTPSGVVLDRTVAVRTP